MAQWIVDGLTATISGIATVFIVLIIIALIIGSLKYLINPFKTINRIQGISRTDDNKPSQTSETQSTTDTEVMAEVLTESEDDEIDDLTLVAVITAAIASTLEVSEDKLVVRSIKRVNDSGNWSRRRSNQ